MAPVRVRKKKDGKSFEVVKMTPVKRSARTPRKATEKVVGRWREREALFDTFPSDVEKITRTVKFVLQRKLQLLDLFWIELL
ncbi:hypothetical protein BWQ96_10514 [Gracilariopsis chorda]|uniref:Uncharacterized protein n=1 Tax=Gracilariopsis chorda TaxID=448386 RepID=A0A2V3ICG3_9FLOR|nr:hypothetical protein BWQ96_10514 [Gracilariopsis chorda]|eukprot:PXF39779.1 hypothetical protein BWQ96_10514 [Gracilariopsis chorda]